MTGGSPRILGLNLLGIGNDWRDSKDSGAESVVYRGPLEGLPRFWAGGTPGILGLNLAGIERGTHEEEEEEGQEKERKRRGVKSNNPTLRGGEQRIS